jgi:hypothetical protein
MDCPPSPTPARTSPDPTATSRQRRHLLLGSLSTLWLAACGGGSAGSDAAAQGPAPSPSPSPDPAPPGTAHYADLSFASLGPNADLNGALPFSGDNDWNRDISTAEVDPNSDALIASIGLATGLKN